MQHSTLAIKKQLRTFQNSYFFAKLGFSLHVISGKDVSIRLDIANAFGSVDRRAQALAFAHTHDPLLTRAMAAWRSRPSLASLRTCHNVFTSFLYLGSENPIRIVKNHSQGRFFRDNHLMSVGGGVNGLGWHLFNCPPKVFSEYKTWNEKREKGSENNLKCLRKI